MPRDEPDSINHGTYKQGKHRLDWALLSEDIQFKQYQVLPDIVSDHGAIIVEVTYAGSDQQASDERDVAKKNPSDGQCKEIDADKALKKAEKKAKQAEDKALEDKND